MFLNGFEWILGKFRDVFLMDLVLMDSNGFK